MNRGRTATRLAFVALLAIHFAVLVHSARTNWATVDEPAHLASGIHLWQTGTLTAYRVNPPLSRALASLPVVLSGRAPRLDTLAGRHAVRPEGMLATRLVDNAPDDFFDFLVLARLMGLLWSAVGALIVYRWAGELAGASAALLASVVYLFEPNVMAHAALVTPDVPAAVAGLAASYALFRYLRRPTAIASVIAGALLGIAQLTKYTHLVLYAAWAIAAVAAYGLDRRSPRRRTGWRRAADAGLVVLVSLVVLNAGYAFHGTGKRLGDYAFVSHTFGGVTPPAFDDPDPRVRFGNRFAHGPAARIPIPLPEDYIRGIDIQRNDFERQLPSYLGGVWQNTGWWHYYLHAALVKTPLGLLALGAWALGRWIAGHARGKSGRFDRAWLALALPPIGIFVLVSSQTGFNHHYRYVLPALPFACVAIGSLGPVMRRSAPIASGVLAGLLAWATVSAVRLVPHQLSFFNEIAGGPERGSEHLVDSNIDWGQDVLSLQRWLEENPGFDQLQMAYFGSIDPIRAGLSYRLAPPAPRGGDAAADTAEPSTAGPRPGHYAISVNFVRGMRFGTFDGQGRQVMALAGDYAYFQQFVPVGRAGYSILLYDIRADEANRARSEMGLAALPP